MKRIFLLVCFLSFGIAQAEEKPKTEDRFGVSAGIIGVWGFYEKAITKNFTLHSQIGYHGGFMMGTDSKLDYVFTTSIRAEPRYYYNLSKRDSKGKSTSNNAGSYLGLELSYLPDLLTSTNRKGVDVSKALNLIPKYGLRRNISSVVSFEFAFGVGYAWGEHNVNGTAVALDLRFDFNL